MQRQSTANKEPQITSQRKYEDPIINKISERQGYQYQHGERN